MDVDDQAIATTELVIREELRSRRISYDIGVRCSQHHAQRVSYGVIIIHYKYLEILARHPIDLLFF